MTSPVTNVSFAMRQIYLKQIHKECVLLYKSTGEARTEAVANEKRCFLESGQRKAGYINMVVKTVQVRWILLLVLKCFALGLL